MDKSLLTASPCRAPCWAGLVPGEATETDVYLALQISPWVQPGSIDSRPYATPDGRAGRLIGWKDRAEDLYDWNRTYVLDGRLVQVQVYLDYPLTLGEAVETYGPPKGCMPTTPSWSTTSTS